jgi:hypothetical protein
LKETKFSNTLYHLECTVELPLSWHRLEQLDSYGIPDLIVFDFYWAEFPDAVP